MPARSIGANSSVTSSAIDTFEYVIGRRLVGFRWIVAGTGASVGLLGFDEQLAIADVGRDHRAQLASCKCHDGEASDCAGGVSRPTCPPNTPLDRESIPSVAMKRYMSC